jgi:histidyl-tRNA synthetase
MSKQQIQTLKGFRDFLPQDALKRQWLKNKIIRVFELWGYDPLETPTLEPLELFAGQIGEDEKLFFKFKDPGDRDVALRYDQTVPTCRVVGQYAQELPMPFRRYQIQSAFRAENTQKGRYREFLQCDADIFGSDSPLADAEVIALSLDIYRQLGFPQAQVLINDRALLKDMPYTAIVAIDKLEKIGEAGVIQEMVRKGIPTEKAQEYLNYIQTLEPNETIKVILNYLEKQGFDPSWYKFDPTIARSFSYSTGPIWEIKIPGSSGGSVLGGERFDKLIEKVSGVSIPGTGFAVGFDRTLEAAEELGLLPQIDTETRVLVTIFEESYLNTSLEAAAYLRAAGINTELYPDAQQKIAKQMKYANKKGIPFVVIIGEEEKQQGTVAIKEMSSGEQKTVTLKEAASILQK